MLNDGTGHYSDITASAGLLETVPDGILQALMRDFDNDGYVDLIVSGMMGAKYFKNNGNKTFTPMDLPLLKTMSNVTESPLRSFAIGDLNHDGFQDIYASYYYGGSDPDQLWLNNGNNNHFVAITLTGTQSNRSAVGAKITVKRGTSIYTREVRAGESYGISNTLTQIIGVGDKTTIDSINVQWPSGSRTTIQNPVVDTFLSIEEPACKAQCISATTKIIR
jgi:hypothetical protein